MSQERSKPVRRSATEYRLSITSNPESRRSSLGGTLDSGRTTLGKKNRSGAGSVVEDGESIIQEFILPQIREFSDSMITLDANFTQLNFIHESLVDLNESLGSLLYGLMCNSWCVDFPHVSHDIEKELQTARRLEDIRKERNSLSEQLSVYKNRNKNRIIQSRPSLPRPIVPVSQASQKNSSVFAPPPSRLPRQKLFSSIERDSDDENASEASFISNPTIDGLGTHGISKPRPRNANKLRRKSILHSIRNSISSMDIENDEFAPSQTTHHSRISLGGGATRLINNNNISQTSPPRRSVDRTKSRSTQPRRGGTRIDNRPPFR